MILRPWTGTNKPPLGVRPIPGHRLWPTWGLLLQEGSGNVANALGSKASMLSQVTFGSGETWGYECGGPGISSASGCVGINTSGLSLGTTHTVAFLVCPSSATTSNYLLDWRTIGTWVIGGSPSTAGQWQFYEGTAWKSIGAIRLNQPQTVVVSSAGTRHRGWVNGALGIDYTGNAVGAGAVTVLFDRFNRAGEQELLGTCGLVLLYDWEWGDAEASMFAANPWCWLGVPDLASMYYSIPAAGGVVPPLMQENNLGVSLYDGLLRC